VYGGALYTTEYIEPGAKFRFSITCRNLPNYALGLLALVIERINDGYIKIGGFKSRGFGAVKIEELKFKNREAESSLKMRSLEPSIDLEVDLSNVARLENGWIVAEKNDAWEIIKKLRGVWDIVAKSD
ncbi:MAG: RAMP superfamily CRISPR-associated protein, partial [Candidatus Methanomethyliaceae archaeon]|nr:RAMP superfamily CRISPR-associated protein [Candidatus Methanomethyliaceae archaeon]